MLYSLREARQKASLRVTNITIKPTQVYDTYKGRIKIFATINGISAEFLFLAARGDNIFFGIDCNEALVEGKRIKISDGGSQTTYALILRKLKDSPKKNQKNFAFTGQHYLLAPLKDEFKKKLTELYENGELTEEFKTTFNLP